MSVKVAALYVEEEGCYTNLNYVDAWPKDRDARKYNGPFPVVAHPPCQLWGAMAYVNYARWGGEHNKPGNDGGCFLSALKNVIKYGGVLEHPAKTKAFDFYNIREPMQVGWQRISNKCYICEVWQSAYGHKANKATWLLYCGSKAPFELNWNKVIGTHQIGFHDQRGKIRNKPTLSKKEANATPILFRDTLIKLAIWSKNDP